MGFTPLEGLVMATRSGSVDPGLVLWLEEHEQLTPHEVATALEQRSGLLALAGDGRHARGRGAAPGPATPDAHLALDVYGHRLVGAIAAMAAALGGLDVLAFTGGVGEHSARIRADAVARVRWLGVALDEHRNAAAHTDAEIGAHGAAVRIVVVAAREDLQIARETRALLGS